MGLGIKFYQSLFYALALHATALVALCLTVVHLPQAAKEKAVTISLAADPEIEYFQSSPEPVMPEKIIVQKAGTNPHKYIKTVAPLIAAKGKTRPKTYLETLQIDIQEASHGLIPQNKNKNEKVVGSAILRLEFNRDGTVLSYSLVQKSDNDQIDMGALATGKKLLNQKLPPAPKDFDKNQQILTYDFGISYNSEDKL